MKRLALIALALAAVALPALVLSSSSASLYNRGNELYKAGSFPEAATAYRDALKTGAQNPELYYNLGNAELRAGRLGPAVASYLRARRLAPRDADINFNLSYAQQQIMPRMPEDQAGPLSRAFDFLVGLVSANEALAALAGLYWIAAAAALGLILSRGERLRRVCRTLITAAAMVAVAFLPVAAARIHRDLLTDRAVMLVKETARSGPGETNSKLFELAEGAEVEVGQCESGWCEVSARSGFNGWVQAKGFERL